MHPLRRLLLLAAFPGTFRAALAAPGDLDPLDARIGGGTDYFFLAATAVQPNGKIILGGKFVSVLGVARSNLARLNADGTLDTGFNPRAGGNVWSVAVQVDGKVLLGGEFTALRPYLSPIVTRRHIARLNPEGTLDNFDPNANDLVHCVAVQADGKILIGGDFTTLQPNGAPSPTPRQYIARVNADGTLDTSFDPKADSCVLSIAVQADGKILIGGDFETLQPNGTDMPTPRSGIARLNEDGTLDASFQPDATWGVTSVTVQADEKVLFGGYFIGLSDTGGHFVERGHIARVNADGTLDTSFDPKANESVLSIAVQADGKILLGGNFTTLQPNGASAPIARNKLARLNADGTLDINFDPNPNYAVQSVALAEDGKVLLGGQFTTFQPNDDPTVSPRASLARLLNDPATQTLTTPNSAQILWQRGGTAPEVIRVTFDLSTDDGTNWLPLGPGTRFSNTADWQLSGLSISGTGRLRARGVTSDGSSSGLIEQIARFPPTDADQDGLLDSWELTWWPATTGHSATDDADHDGYNELLELALGLNPTIPNPGGLPPVTNEAGHLTMTLTKQPGVTYEIQSAGTLLSALPDSFSAANTTIITNDSTTLKVRDNFPIGTPHARFLRVKVTAAP